MKKRIQTMFAGLFVVIMTICAVFSYEIIQSDSSTHQTEAATIELSDCTSSNPLTVIEIVPYIMYAEFGYHIAGGEVADYQKMEEAGTLSISPVSGNGTEYASFAVNGTYYYTIYSKEYFKRYSLELDMVDDALLKKQAIRNRITELMEEDDAEDSFVEACQKELDTTYAYTTEEKKNLDTFNAVAVEYKAVLISEVNENPAILDNADLILITGIRSSYSVYGLRKYLSDEYKEKLLSYNPMSDSELESSSMNAYETSMEANPFYYDELQRLSFKSARHIFELSAKIGGVPVIMHNSVLRSNQDENKYLEMDKITYDEETGERKASGSKLSSEYGCNNNVYKLYLMLYQKGAVKFKEQYYDYITEDGEYTLQTGDAKSFWGIRTFVDYDSSGNESYDKGDYLHSFNNILISNGFTYNNDASPAYLYTEDVYMDISVTDGITESNDMYVKDTFKYNCDVVDTFEEGTTYISIADAIKYLLLARFQSTYEKDSLKVLEIEPSNDYTLSESVLKSYFQTYTGQITIDHMTMQEFNGTNCDLAGEYDLIYLGEDTGGLSSTNNDSDYKDMIYMHTGDSVDITLNGTDSTEWYSGNDITKEKEKQIIAYIEAGYPMIVSDSLYTKTNIDTASNVYDLLSNYILDEDNSRQCVSEQDFVTGSAEAEQALLSYLNLKRPTVTVTKEAYLSSKLTVSFSVDSLEEGETAKAALYIDSDGDGVIEEDAVKNITVTGPDETEICYDSETVTLLANAVAYRLVITASDDSNRYTVTTNTVTRTNQAEKTLNILQITTEESTINLSDQDDLVGSTLSKQTEYNAEVTMVTVNEFEALYDASKEGMPYSADSLISDKLISYDVIVLGCGESYPIIDNSNGAVDNLIACLNRDQGLVITNGVLIEREDYGNEKTKEAYAKLRTLAGMERYNEEQDTAYQLNLKSKTVASDGYTYAFLNQIKQTTSNYSLFDYSGAVLTNSNAYLTDSITKVNDGSVTNYPYKIEGETLSQSFLSGEIKKTMTGIKVEEATSACYQLYNEGVTGYYALANDEEQGRMLYSTSPNDVQNNYYLYNCGQIWYSAIGRTTLTSSSLEEAKLFVNTLIAAGSSMGKAPNVSFIDVHTDSEGENVAFFEADVYDANNTKSKTLTFVPEEPVTSSDGLTATVYIETDGVLTQLTSVTKKSEAEVITLADDPVSADCEYELTIPAELLDGEEVNAYVYVENEYGIGFAKCKIVRRDEFNLD